MTPPRRKTTTNLTSVTVSMGRHHLPASSLSPFPVLPCAALAASTLQAHWLLFSGLAPPAGMPAPHLSPVPPLVWLRGLLHKGEASQGGLPTFEALLLPQAVPSFMPFLWLFFFHSVFLRFILYFFLYFKSHKQKHNSKSSHKGTWLL